MKYKIKIGAILLCICLLVPIFGVTSYAASGSVSISSKSGTVGNKVTITCTVKCSTGKLGTADVVLEYEPSELKYVSGDKGNAGYSLSGQAGSVVYAGVTPSTLTDKFTFTMTFEILKKGTHTISVKTASAYDIDETLFTPSYGSGKITGTEPTNNNNTANNNTNNNAPQNNKDSNNKLSSLQVYPGTLSPVFAAGTTSYNVTVSKDTKEVTISATPQSNKATITVSGGKDLKPGANAAQVIVVAENGSSIAYNITIMCGEEEKIAIDGTDYTIDEDFVDNQIPMGFTRTQVIYKERQYEAVTNATGNLSLLSLKNEAGSQFYIYNPEMQKFYNFVQISIAEGKYLVPLPLEEKTEGFEGAATTILTIQGKTFDAWKLSDEFSVIQTMNQDGDSVLYRYDSVDGTFQRYVEPELAEIQPGGQETAMFPNQYYLYTVVGLASLVLILSIALIYFVASRKHRHVGRKNQILKRQEKQKVKEEKATAHAISSEETEETQRTRRKTGKWILIVVSVLVLAGLAVFGVNKYMGAQQEAAEAEQARKEAEQLKEYVGKPLTDLMEKVDELNYDATYYEGDAELTDFINSVKQDYSVAEVQVSDVLKKVKVTLVLNVVPELDVPEELLME